MEPRFLLDGMLGSLSRWLRIGGYDTKYRKDTLDDALIDEAIIDTRILLTRDEDLVKRAKKRGVAAIKIKNGGDEEALSQLKDELEITLDPKKARCPKCNDSISRVVKANIVGKVPDRTLGAIDEYWACSGCGSIYWRGSHWPKIIETLNHSEKQLE